MLPYLLYLHYLLIFTLHRLFTFYTLRTLFTFSTLHTLFTFYTLSHPLLSPNFNFSFKYKFSRSAKPYIFKMLVVNFVKLYT